MFVELSPTIFPLAVMFPLKVALPFEARVKAVVFSLTLKVELPADSKLRLPALVP